MTAENRQVLNNYRKGEKGALVGILTNALLFIVKLIVGFLGGSHALVADALHTASDLTTSFTVFVGFRIGRKPADLHHPYGHGRAESIAAKLVAIILIIFGFWIGIRALSVLFSRREVVPHILTLWVTILSIITKEWLFRYAFGLGKKINSTSLIADAWHHRSDAISSCAALAGIAGARMGFVYLDPIAGIIVAAIVIKLGFDLFHRAYDELMDAALGQNVMNRIRKCILNTEGVKSLFNLKARKAGMEIFVDMTVKVARNKSVEEGHKIAEDVKKCIFTEIPYVKEILVHVEPYKK